MPGIISTRVGYTGGEKPNPTYYSLGGHTESFQVDYDPAQISYNQLLDLFWLAHNPHSRPFSQQYKAAVFYHNDTQRAQAGDGKQRLEQSSGKPVHTEILPLGEFYRAEDYHQKYYLRSQERIMQELRGIYASNRAFVDSTLAARLNAYVALHGYSAVLRAELDSYGLGAELNQWLADTAAPRLDEGAFGAAACGITPKVDVAGAAH